MARRNAAQTANTETAETETTPMSDATAETVDNTTEAGTSEGNHKFNINDEVSVIRGALRGRKGEIISHDPNKNQYAVRLDGGELAVLNAGNLKAPADATVSVKALVSALAGFGQEAGSADRDAATRLAAMLDETVPGVSTKLNEAFSA